MKNHFMAVAVGGLLVASIQAKAANNESEECAIYVGQTVTPQSFDQATGGFAALPPKGEFETTAAYEARKASALGAASGVLIIGKEPEDRKYFEYNADSQRLGIKSYAFDNTSFDAWKSFYAAGYYGKIEVSTMGNIDAVISSVDKPNGTYEGSNSFGAKATIQKVHRTTTAIFEGAGRPLNNGLFPQAEKSPYEVASLQLTPSEAQQLKPLLQVAFVVQPKEPFVVKGTRSVGETTIRNPIDVTEDFEVLVADFRCGLLLDGNNKVLGSYATR